MSRPVVPWKSVVAAALVAPLAACGLHGRPAVARKARPVAATPAAAPTPAEAGADTVVAPGIVEPWGDQVLLAAQESGWIARMEVREGDVVKPGQPVAALDDAVQRRGVEAAAAELARAEAALVKTERGPTAEELRQAEAEVEAESAREALATTLADRAVRLREVGVATDDARDRATADARAQAAVAERARARLKELRRGPREEDRAIARLQVEAARARLRLAQESLERRHIASPVAGTVLLSRFHPGEYYDVGAGPLLIIGDTTRLQVRLEVDEIDALDVETGAPCRLASDAGGVLADGVVVRLAPRMGRRTLKVESPTAREDVRVREVFVETGNGGGLLPGLRVWGRVARTPGAPQRVARLSRPVRDAEEGR